MVTRAVWINLHQGDEYVTGFSMTSAEARDLAARLLLEATDIETRGYQETPPSPPKSDKTEHTRAREGGRSHGC